MATRKKQLSQAEIVEAEVKQLRHEAQIPKMKVSEAVKEMQAFIEERQDQDYLVRGFEQSPKKNPFRKKKFENCALF